jgi:hypothetical protein
MVEPIDQFLCFGDLFCTVPKFKLVERVVLAAGAGVLLTFT